MELTLIEFLLPGPKLLTDIASILMKKRAYKFVLISEIVKIITQILIAPEDRR